jgi:hypothetical protein
MINMLTQFTKFVPKIKGPIQLAGFVFSIFSTVLTYRVDPNNILALSIVGAIGIALITLPLAFHQNVLKYIPDKQRVWFMLVLVSILLISFGAMASMTYTIIKSPPPKGARFDSKLITDKISYIKKPDNTYRIELTWQLFPLSSREDQGATVFLGMVSIHDENKIKEAGLGKITGAACEDVPSCVGSYVFRELSLSPVLVRSGTPGTTLTAVVDVRRIPKNLRVWWEFYQLEGNNGELCGVDHNKAAPKEGIPPLAMFKSERRVGDLCYRSFGQKTFREAIN